MDTETYNAIVERAIITKRIAELPSFGSNLCVCISRQYPTINAITSALEDGSFSFPGVGPGRVLKLLAEFCPKTYEQRVAANQLIGLLKAVKKVGANAILYTP